MQKFIITGNTPSKSNCYKVIRLGNRCGLGKQKKPYDYEKSFLYQMLQYDYEIIEGNFKFIIDVFYDSRRPDLDNSLKVVLDCLQKAKAIKNDNKCLEINAYKHLDKLKPRIEFSIVSL
jgi:Holliday junction resolvase RusA-like endonuclease